MNPDTRLTQFLLGFLKVQMADPQPYLFDKDCLVLPAHLKDVLSVNVVQDFVHAHRAASTASKYIRVLEKNHQKRYNAMCPLSTPNMVLKHINSVRRLVAWKADQAQNNPTLAPTPKIHPSTVKFHVNHRAYDGFAQNYVELLERFVEEPYSRWFTAKQELERSIANANLSEMDYSEWHQFWDLTFLVEMGKWEDRLQGLILPSWEEMMESLCSLIFEFVDSPQAVLTDLYRVSGLMSQ